jgi:hypothetical protein
MSNQNKLIAQEILRQLGGNKFVVMTGSKNFIAGDHSLSMKLSKNSSGANYLRIKLNGLDLYDIEFISIRGTKMKTKHEFKDVYCERLVATFEETTGLYTSL